MIIAIASGKGGTGKTTVAVNLALSLEDVLLIDADVEEPNDYIFLKPHIERSEPVHIMGPEIDIERCTFCGECARFCNYNALAVIREQVLVFQELCHGCGGCALVCPEGAIKEVPRQIGVVEEGQAGHISFRQGWLNVGEAIAPLVIHAEKQGLPQDRLVLIDSSPGNACPAVEALSGSDYALLVTEPTPFGLHDLRIAVEVATAMGIPCGVIINRSDEHDELIEAFCREKSIPILERIPFSREIAVAYSKGIPFVQVMPEWRERLRRIPEVVQEAVQ